VTTIEQIRAELDAATPGPWEVVEPESHGPGIEAPGANESIVVYSDDPEGGVETGLADATLIAHAPTYLASLLDVAEAAQRFMDAADLRLGQGDAYFDTYHDARHDLYQALAVIPQQYAKDGE
jgi:hypothetical protein